MSHFATGRLLLQPAPHGLALVQDLLNTRDIGGKVPDLLATVNQARDWLADALGSDDPAVTWTTGLSERELDALRVLRADVLSAASRDSTCTATVITRIGLSVQPSGELRLEPTGTRTRWLTSVVWGAVFLAQQSDSWKRLKLCHNTACSSAFYDRSKNNSGVWHDVKVCGNAANLRASRARRKVADEQRP